MDKEFWKRLKEIRLERGITQELLAEAAGVSRDSVQRAERGRVHPKTLAKILKVMKLRLSITLEPIK